MLAIRREQFAILAPLIRGDVEPNLIRVSSSSDIETPVPYLRWQRSTGIVVLANRNEHADAHVVLNVPVEHLGPTNGARYAVTDLWNAGPTQVVSSVELSAFPYRIRPDKSARGGIGILKVERLR